MRRLGKWVGRVLRWTCWGALAGVMALAVAVYGFPYDASRLRDGGGPLVIVDQQGNVLRAIPGADARREAWVELDDIPPSVAFSASARSRPMPGQR